MPKYCARLDFTAQSHTVTALLHQFGRLRRDPTGAPRHELLPIVVFTAFAIEGYLNSLGARFIRGWDDVERASWKAKVVALHLRAGKDVEWGKEPLQFAKQVFECRDRLAHGKPERVRSKPYDTVAEAHDQLSDPLLHMEPAWFERITVEWTLEAQERFRLLMAYFASLFDLLESDHLLRSTGCVDTLPDPAD